MISQALHSMSTQDAFYALITQHVNSVGFVLVVPWGLAAEFGSDLLQC